MSERFTPRPATASAAPGCKAAGSNAPHWSRAHKPGEANSRGSGGGGGRGRGSCSCVAFCQTCRYVCVYYTYTCIYIYIYVCIYIYICSNCCVSIMSLKHVTQSCLLGGHRQNVKVSPNMFLVCLGKGSTIKGSNQPQGTQGLPTKLSNFCLRFPRKSA